MKEGDLVLFYRVCVSTGKESPSMRQWHKRNKAPVQSLAQFFGGESKEKQYGEISLPSGRGNTNHQRSPPLGSR